MKTEMNIFEFLHEKYVLPKKVRLFETFAGIGCQRMAFNRLGIEVEMVGISEIDKYAIKSYMAIHGETKNWGSICDVRGQDLPEIDVFTYSFPCTDLSKAGKQKGLSQTRSGLVYEVLRILHEMTDLPKVLIMENVVDLVQSKFIRQFNEIQAELESLGYTNYAETMNAKDFGVAQNRDRIFMVSVLGGKYYEFPKPFTLTKRLKDYLQLNVEEKYYLSDKALNWVKTSKFECNTRVNDIDGVAACIDTMGGGNREPKIEITDPVAHDEQNQYIRQDGCVGTLTTDGSSPKHNNRVIEPVCLNSKVDGKQPSLQDRVYDSEAIATAVTTGFMPSVTEPRIHEYNVTQKVSVRKHEVDIERLRIALIESKKKVGTSNTDLSKKFCLPLTLVEHWFRKDDSFSIPSKEIWFELKKELGIDTDQFDESIVEFIEKDNVFEKSNRVYGENGISPTITCVSADEKITNGIRIRKLTPLECWRLMGIDDTDFAKASQVCSNSQLYKQAGNGIVVDVFAEILRTMKEDE